MKRDCTKYYDIQALIDNELDHEEQKQVLDHIQSNPKAKKRYEELKAQKSMLQKWSQSRNT